jgi:hypothetical protein
MLYIKRGMKQKKRQLISNFLKERIGYHFESFKMLEELQRIF